MTAYTFNQLFDFTRTTSATFVGSNGLIQTTPASVNLLTYTQEFDNSGIWGRSGTVSVVANTTQAPDGTTTADTVLFPANLDRIIQVASSLLSATTYVFSVYVKGTSGETVNVELGSAILTVTLDGTWQRVSVTNTGSTSYNVTLIRRSTTATSVFIWGAQLEANTVATTYTRNNGGVYPARFDYDPVTLAPKGILIEEQRTNLAIYSQQFDNAAWPKNGITVSANAATSPEGSSNAEAITENTANTTHQLFQNISFTSGVAYTASVYVKQSVGTRRLNIALGSAPFGAELYATYNLSTLAISVSVGVTASIENAGNGWYRCRMTATATATASDGFIFRLGNSDAATFFSYTGDGTSTLLLYGAQLEAGAFATSYIPTVASQVTRSTDLCTISAPMFAPWYSQTQGTIIAVFSSFATGGGSKIVAELNDGTSANRYTQVHNPGASDRFLTFIGGAAVVTTLDYTAVGANVVGKWAGAYAAGNYGASLNGAAALTSTYASLPAGINSLAIGSSAGGTALSGHIQSIKYYPFRASNNQLQALTT